MNKLAFPLPTIALVSALAGCASSGLPEVTGAPVADAGSVASRLASTTLPASPFQVNFGWTLQEGGSRASGRGVVRVEAPERIRLDLFGPRGETFRWAESSGFGPRAFSFYFIFLFFLASFQIHI